MAGPRSGSRFQSLWARPLFRISGSGNNGATRQHSRHHGGRHTRRGPLLRGRLIIRRAAKVYAVRSHDTTPSGDSTLVLNLPSHRARIRFLLKPSAFEFSGHCTPISCESVSTTTASTANTCATPVACDTVDAIGTPNSRRVAASNGNEEPVALLDRAGACRRGSNGDRPHAPDAVRGHSSRSPPQIRGGDRGPLKGIGGEVRPRFGRYGRIPGQPCRCPHRGSCRDLCRGLARRPRRRAPCAAWR